MKDHPVLERVYARVDILDFDRSNESFAKISSIFMIGEAAHHVKSIEDFNVRNKKLVASIGIDAVKDLMISKQVSGGDDWEELDDIDFEELLNTDNVEVVDNSEVPAKGNHGISGNLFTDYTLYESDKMNDICEKIALTTRIEPFKQYIWIPSMLKSFSGNDVSLMHYWTTSLRKIEGYPIDGQLIDPANSVGLSIKEATNTSSIVLTCVCLDALVKNKSRLQFIARSDSESYELIHTNAFQQFFPSITLPIFNQYLIDDSSIGSKYESCYFNFKETKSRYIDQAKVIADLSKQNQITIDSSDFLTVTTIGIDMAASYSDNHIRVDTINLFQAIDSNSFNSIAFIDLYCLDDDMRYTRLRKIQQRDQYRIKKDEPLVAIGSYTKKKLIQSKSIVITLLPQNEFDSTRIIIDRYGSVIIRSQPNQVKSFSKAAFMDFIASIVNPIIDQMNSIDLAFSSHERFAKINDTASLKYHVPSSSSKLSFRFAISYKKMLDLVIKHLVSGGFVSAINTDQSKRNNMITSFGIRYGVSKDVVTGFRRSSIDIRSVSDLAIIVLSNLDVGETDLYVDIIGRLINLYKSDVLIPADQQTQLSIVDPVLFRTKVSSDGYSRICQKKFQPVLSSAKDPKAVQYHNFTFDRPEYYSCPTKHAPVLGFILGKHERGYCLPCCRKTPQADEQKVKESCISNTMLSNERLSTYKVDYPIVEVPNLKIMNRRVSLPSYITNLLGIPTAVANGTIMSSHGGVRDGADKSSRSYLQTAIIIAAIDNNNQKPIYESSRELVLDIIAMIKQPLMQVNIMKNRLISSRFATPQALIHSIEDYYIRDKILESNANLSAVEWNDLIIFLSNCMGLNVLLLEDERIKDKGLHLVNLHDVDVSKPVSILLKRTNIEWSDRQHNTRALYLPVTLSSFKVLKISILIIPRFNISSFLSKIRRITSGAIIQFVSEQFTLQRVVEVVRQNKKFKLLEDISDQKLVAIGIGRNTLISSIYTITSNVKPKDVQMTPDVSFRDMCLFISEYNTHFINETPNIANEIKSYKNYLNVAIKISNRYQFIRTSAFLLKVHRFVIHDSMVIGVVIRVIDIDKVVSTELMFMKPTPKKLILTELTKLQTELKTLHERMNAIAILSFPIGLEVLLCTNPADTDFSFEHTFITWLNNPLKSSTLQPKGCKQDMRKDFSIGTYYAEIYNILVSDIMKAWKNEQESNVVQIIIQTLKKAGALPVAPTKIDKLILEIEQNNKYDPIIIRDAVSNLFDHINAIDKNTAQAIARVKDSALFMGFELKNVHRLGREQIKNKVATLMKELTIKSLQYPSFDMDKSIKNQLKKFYDNKTGKLIIHASLFNDVIDMIVSDLINPFRRDYITNLQLIDSSLSDIKPHFGELIYIQHIKS